MLHVNSGNGLLVSELKSLIKQVSAFTNTQVGSVRIKPKTITFIGTDGLIIHTIDR